MAGNLKIAINKLAWCWKSCSKAVILAPSHRLLSLISMRYEQGERIDAAVEDAYLL